MIDQAQRDEVPKLTSVVSESIPHLKRGAVRDFENILNEHRYWKDGNWNASDHIYTFETGSKIEFFSADQGDKLRGARRDRLFLNEANNVTLDAFDQLEVRTKEFCFLDWNPVSEYWFYSDVLGHRDDIDFIKLTYLDNEALSEQEVKSIEARRDRTNWFRVYGLGELGESETKIYKNWQTIDEIPHEARLVKYGLDFGYSVDPTSIIAIYFYNGGYILDEICYQNGLTNRQIANILLNLEKAAVIADSAEPKSIDEISSYGVMIMGAQKGADSVNQGIQFVQDQKISVTKRSLNVLKEYRNYFWEKDKNGKILQVPESGFDHTMDAIRYAIASEFPRRKTEQEICKALETRELIKQFDSRKEKSSILTGSAYLRR